MLIVASRHAYRLLGPAESAYVRLVGQVLLNARATHRLLEATAAQARFVQAFSHEVRLPLHGVIGQIDLLRDACAQSPHSDLLPDIEVADSCALSLQGAFAIPRRR